MIRQLAHTKWKYYLAVGCLLAPLIALFLVSFNRYLSTSQIVSDDQLLYTPPSEHDHYKVRHNDATITFVNYFSMDCVHCRKAFLMEDALLDKEHPRKINIIYRHNPLDSQPLSYEKALIAECVYAQSNDETFFALVRDVFTHYDDNSYDNTWMKTIAKKYVSNSKVFEECLGSDLVKKQIADQKKANAIANITYTPTVLIFEKNKFIKKYEAVGERFVTTILEYYLDH